VRKLLLYLVYTLFILKSLSIEHFTISFIIFNLHFKYSNVALRYIYNNLNIKDYIFFFFFFFFYIRFIILRDLCELYIIDVNVASTQR